MNLDEWVAPSVHPEVRAHINSLVSALGGPNIEEDGRYELGDDVVACLKDIRRWIKLHDGGYNRHDVARALAEANTVNNDLLEILSVWPEEGVRAETLSRAASACLEVLVPLTWPLEKDDLRMTIHNHKHIPYLQLAQVRYKRQILQHDSERILRTAVRIALPAMAEAKNERSTRDEGVIKLMLYFLRNIAIIEQPQRLPSEGDEADISRSALIDAFSAQHIFQVILSVASSIGEEFVKEDVIILELLFHLLKGVDPDNLFTEEKRLASANTSELKGLISKEKAMLAGYAKHAPSRHNRFGTMIWVKREGDRLSTVSGQDFLGNDQRSLKKMDGSKRWDKPKFRGKRAEQTPLDEFNVSVPLSVRARKSLRAFVEDFLDSSFNPLFTHLRKAMEREVDRVLGAHSMQYFYLISWFLRAESARRKLARQSDHAQSRAPTQVDEPPAANPGVESFALVASVLIQETFVQLNRFMQRSHDEMAWHDLNAGMKCFTQILLTIQEMADSTLEEDQDIAENIQNRIFYEETTHDRVIHLLRSYRDQGFGYLDACTELAHVFLRMLERYSKQNVDLQIRSKRRARMQNKESRGEGGNAYGEDDDPYDVAEAHRAATERKFDFHRLAAKFATQPCVQTFISLARYYNDLSAEQLKRAHRYIHRVAFKMELEVILFRVDYLQLFMKMIKGPNGLDPEAVTFKEWEELIRHLFRICVKKLQDRPELAVEMLFSKIPATMFYLEHGYDREQPASTPRAPAELEIKPGLDRKAAMGVAVSILLNQTKMDALAWLRDVLSEAADERKAWEDSQPPREAIGGEPREIGDGDAIAIVSPADAAESTTAPPSILVKPDTDERRQATFKDNKLRLMMSLVGFERMGDPTDPLASWIIPSTLRSEQLLESLNMIRELEYDPPSYDEGKSALDFVRSKAAAAAAATRKRRVEYDDDTEGSEGEDLLFPAGGPTTREKDGDEARPTKRRRLVRRMDGEEVDIEELERRRDKRRQTDMEKRRKIKSDLMVHDSDDESDDERDNEFFSKEENVRKSTRDSILKALSEAEINSKTARSRASGAAKKKGAGKRTSMSGSENDSASDSEDVEAGDSLTAKRSSPLAVMVDSDSVEEEEETPLSSPHRDRIQSQGDLTSDPINPSQEDPALVTKLFGSGLHGGEESEDDVVPLRSTQRKSLRAGFTIDSDSD